MSARRHTQRIQPSNRYELFLKSSLSAKGRRSTDPITNFRAKVRMSPGKPETPLSLHSRAYFNPPPPPPFNTKQDSFPSDRQRKTEFLTFIPIMTITTIYTNKYMDINVYSFPHRHDVMISNMNYLGQCG